MTISSETKRSPNYVCNGSVANFSVPFYILDENHIAVYLLDTVTGVQTLLTLTTDYTVNNVGVPAGSDIDTVITYPLGKQIFILRAVPLTQLKDYIPNDTFPAESHEEGLDKLTMLFQQQQEILNRSLRVPESNILNTPILPSIISNAGKVLMINPTEDNFSWYDITGLDPFDPYKYYVDPSAVDQGVSSTKSIKALLDIIGTTKKATIVVPHNSANDETEVTVTTPITIPQNVALECKSGIKFTGAGAMIVNGPFKIEADTDQVFDPTFIVSFGPGVLKAATPQLWGAKGIGSTFNDGPAIDAMMECLMSSSGFSSWEITGEIPGAAITGPAAFFPAGDYNYEGTGVSWLTGHRTLIMLAHQGTVRIRIPDGIYLVTYELVDNVFVEGINFYGGKGAIKFNSTAVNVRGRVFIQHCWFSYYTECAIGNRTLVGMPYITIRDNMFIGKAAEETIGIALGGRIDDTVINNNSFLRNKYHIKLGGDGVGLSGQIYVKHNSFFRWDTTTDKVADIWIVPNDDSPLGIDSGRNLRIDENKFGNENQQVDDTRILVADEDTGSGTDRLSYHHNTTWNQTGHLAGISFCKNHIQGVSGCTAPLIYSYCENLLMWRFHDNLFGGIRYKYIVEFNGDLDGDAEQTVWSIRLGLSISGNDALQKISNQPLGIVNDPYVFAGGDIATINNYPSVGDDVGFKSIIDSNIRTTGVLNNCTRTNVDDFYGGAFASTLTYSNVDGYWGSADLAAPNAGQPAWVEVDLKQSASHAMTWVKVGLKNWTTGKTAVRRLVNVPTVWRTIRIPFVAPKSASGTWKLTIWGEQFASGVTESVDVGRPKVYQAHQAMNSGHLRIIGSNSGAGKWDGSHIISGDDRLWRDADGIWRTKASAPTSDIDGAAVNARRENILINQDFAIWQENTTFTNPAEGVYTADGFYVGKADGDGTAPSINVKKNTANAETGYAQCCELEITNVGVQGTTVRADYAQTVPDYKKYRSKDVTLSFRVKASTAITLSDGELFIDDGVATANVSVTSITTSWVTYSVTLPAIAAASDKLRVKFNLIPVGAGTISTTGSIYIQFMKLEIGNDPTLLIPKSDAATLLECQPFYQKSYAQGTFAGTAVAAGAIYEHTNSLNSADHNMYRIVKLPVTMNAAPTVTLYDLAGAANKVTMVAGSGIAGTVALNTEAGFRVNASNGAASPERKLVFHYVAVSRP